MSPQRRRPGLAVVLICVCAMASLGWFAVKAWRAPTDAQDVVPRLLAKYEPLRAVLPAGEPVRFMVDLAHADCEAMNPEGRLYLAQFAVSPHPLGDSVASRWIVVDSDSAEAVPEAATHWQLAADLHNGVRLYRAD